MKSNKILTARLVLREITENDTNQIVEWRKNPDVYKFFRAPHEITYEEHMNWYTHVYLVDDLQVQFIAEEKANQIAVGVFSVRKCREKNDCVEVSYLLDKDAQGKGFGQEAVSGMLEYARVEWSVNKAIAEIHEENYSSQKMIQKVGFKLQNKRDKFLIYERQLCYT